MRKLAWIILFSFILTIIAGCVLSKPTIAPPSVKKDMRRAKPGPNHVWISGRWKWTSSTYVWVSGYWTKARPGRTWVSGHWVKRGRYWVWIKGHWKRRQTLKN